MSMDTPPKGIDRKADIEKRKTMVKTTGSTVSFQRPSVKHPDLSLPHSDKKREMQRNETDCPDSYTMKNAHRQIIRCYESCCLSLKQGRELLVAVPGILSAAAHTAGTANGRSPGSGESVPPAGVFIESHSDQRTGTDLLMIMRFFAAASDHAYTGLSAGNRRELLKLKGLLVSLRRKICHSLL